MMKNDPAAAEAVRVWFRLLRLETRIRLALAARLKTIGLSVPQCDVLTTLTEREGVSQQDLAESLYVTKGNISGLIDRLVEAGHVERRAIAHDKRSHAIFLTDQGRATAQAGFALQEAFVHATFGQGGSGQAWPARRAARGHPRPRAPRDGGQRFGAAFLSWLTPPW